MITLKEALFEAKEKNTAIGHFNFSTIEVLWAIARAAKEISVPVIAGIAEGERKFFGAEQALLAVRSISKELNHPIFLNADHTYDLDMAKESVAMGFDSVIFDGAKLSFDENISQTADLVKFTKSSGSDCLIEGELGYIGTSSNLLDSIPDGASVLEESMTFPEEASEFVSKTGVDLLAPAVGNIHGMLKNSPDPDLNIERIVKIQNAIGIPLVLHGASGNSDSDLRASISAGVRIIHVNTELRKAWKEGFAQSVSEIQEVAPYKLLKKSYDMVYQVVIDKLKIFSNIS